MNREHIYLDCAATTPVDSRVLAAMQPFFADCFGNAGSVHGFGQAARAAVDEARAAVAALIGAQPGEIVFTSGAGEANNAAIIGAVRRAIRPETVLISIMHGNNEIGTLAPDLEGIAASSGSTCASGSIDPSHGIAALGLPDRLAAGTLRFSLGRPTTAGEIDRVLAVLPPLLARVRQAGSGSHGVRR